MKAMKAAGSLSRTAFSTPARFLRDTTE
jgi:hypothetical protein